MPLPPDTPSIPENSQYPIEGNKNHCKKCLAHRLYVNGGRFSCVRGEMQGLAMVNHIKASNDEPLLDRYLQQQFPQLSRRQLEIVGHLVHGRGERQIADRLQIARTTVHVHVKELYARVGVRSRGELLGGIIRKLARMIPDGDER